MVSERRKKKKGSFKNMTTMLGSLYIFIFCVGDCKNKKYFKIKFFFFRKMFYLSIFL